jgi:hypothetical protein
MTDIVQGGIYRRKSDGMKIMAVAQHMDTPHWWFIAVPDKADCHSIPAAFTNTHHNVELWREPVKKKVAAYVALWADGSITAGCVSIKRECVIACKRFEVEVTEGEFDG